MPVFAYTIAVDQHRPSEGDGYVRAETAQQAVALGGHPEVNVYPPPGDAAWPGETIKRHQGTAEGPPIWFV